MRVRRLLLISGLLLAGGVAARPEEVIPLASRLVAPMLGHNIVKPAEPELPNFAPKSHELLFSKSETAKPEPATPPSSPDNTGARSTASDIALAPASHTEGDSPARPVNIVVSPDPSLTGVEQRDSAPSEEGAASVPPVQTQDPDTPAGQPGAADPASPPSALGQPAPVSAKTLFGAAKAPAPLAARAIGSYSRGCLAGAVALPVDGTAWQAMRLSRNRNWGHPKLVSLVERLANDAKANDNWPGLLVGDMSQPRGGPMLTGHASHQVGLDADVWLTPMPDHKLSNKEREDISATSMLDKTDLAVDPNVFTANRVKLIKRAASYSEVERVLVHPAIKKALCKAAMTDPDRRWLNKVRPYHGHYYHMHIRIACPPGSFGCVAQKPPPGDDGCTKEVDEWLARLARPPKPEVPGAKPSPPPQPVTLAQLPSECRVVLESGPDGIAAPADVRAATRTASYPGHRVVLKPRGIRHARQ
jgi:penicillin-insensitive murein DD-endopeptidase